MRNKIFICIFFFICLIPLITMGIPNSSKQAANQVLNEPPSFINEEGNININYLSEFSNYFDDHIGLRNHLISAEHKLVATFFGESSEEKVILGKDGWLFYKETLDDFQKTNILTDREIYSMAKTLSLMQEYCESQNMKFAFTVAPNKNSVYGDKMPSYYMQGNGKSNLTKLSDELSKSNVNYIDLLSVIKNENTILYRKTDSHWTNQCAGLAADTILKSLGKNALEYYGTETKVVSAPTGDLYEMLYPAKKDKDTDIVYTHEFSFMYEKPIRTVEDNFIRTVCNEKEGSLYVFRDSFGNTLYPYLADNFGKCIFTRLVPYNLTLPKSENCDTVLVEIVERNLDWILTKPPIFPAPVRAIDSGLHINKNAAISIAENSEIDGFVKIEGTIDNLETYNDNIYIKIGTTIFEATPCASNAFCAFIPSSEDLTNITILTGK